MKQQVSTLFEKIKNFLTLESVKISAKRKFQIFLKVFIIYFLILVKSSLDSQNQRRSYWRYNEDSRAEYYRV